MTFHTCCVLVSYEHTWNPIRTALGNGQSNVSFFLPVLRYEGSIKDNHFPIWIYMNLCGCWLKMIEPPPKRTLTMTMPSFHDCSIAKTVIEDLTKTQKSSSNWAPPKQEGEWKMRFWHLEGATIAGGYIQFFWGGFYGVAPHTWAEGTQKDGPNSTSGLLSPKTPRITFCILLLQSTWICSTGQWNCMNFISCFDLTSNSTASKKNQHFLGRWIVPLKMIRQNILVGFFRDHWLHRFPHGWIKVLYTTLEKWMSASKIRVVPEGIEISKAYM